MAIFIDDKTEFGKIILLKLRDLNKSQKWLSERTGYSYIHIHSIISGKMNPSRKCLHEISKALNIPRENVTVTEAISIADMQDKRKAGYTYMFNFRIITTADGNQIIDRNLKTPYDALTPTQMMEYMEMDNSLAFMDRMERKAREKAEHMRRVARNPFYRLACMVGLM